MNIHIDLPKITKVIALGVILLCLTVSAVQCAPQSAKMEDKSATTPTPAQILARLKPTHPRLLIKSSWPEFKTKVEADKQLSAWRVELKDDADKILAEPVSEYELPEGASLAVSRRVLSRTQTLALAYRLEGNSLYRDRLWRELDAAANFPSWNPSHFLDTAEMTHAFAIGYDWLYDVWTPAQRAILRTAIAQKGLQPGLDSYRNPNQKLTPFWTRISNWNIVCNAGLTAGALAVGDEEPAMSGEVLARAIQTVPTAMREFAPDGAWPEGLMYWNYATSYDVMMIAALDSALGTDYGLSEIPGFDQTGLFPVYMTSPIGRSFNFADSYSRLVVGPQMFWFSKRFNQPLAAQQAILYPNPKDRLPQPYRMLFYQPPTQEVAAPSLDKYFRGVEIVTMRSSWKDPDALFVGFKGGDNKSPHAHLDLGTFVLDALGQRWVSNTTPDQYSLPGYFGSRRWTYYRLRAESKNTLLLNPDERPDQDPKASAKITRFDSEKESALAIVDLTDAYRGVAQVRRGLQLHDRTSHPYLVLQDEITTETPTDLWWSVHTGAEISVSQSATIATLTIKDKQLQVRLLSPPGAKFQVLGSVPLPSSPNPPNQTPDKGAHKLAIHLPSATKERITVAFVPVVAGPVNVSPAIKPLSEWKVSLRGAGVTSE